MTICFLAYGQDYSQYYPNPQEIDHDNCNAYVVLEKDLNSLKTAIADQLSDMGYRKVKFVRADQSSSAGDLQINIISTSGKDPFIPAVYSCNLSTELVTYSDWDLISMIHYDKNSMIKGEKSCFAKILPMVKMLPTCN